MDCSECQDYKDVVDLIKRIGEFEDKPELQEALGEAKDLLEQGVEAAGL